MLSINEKSDQNDDALFVLNLDDHGTIELEAALDYYRSMDLIKASEDESKRALCIHNRLRQSYTLGAGVLLDIQTHDETQTLMNAIAYYNPSSQHLFKRRYCERLTEELRLNSSASVVNIITPKDVDVDVDVDVPDGTNGRTVGDVSPCNMTVGVSLQKVDNE